MRNAKLIGYWTATAGVTFELIVGGAASLVHARNMFVGEPLVEIMHQLGYPEYLLTILGVCKPLGGIVLLMPRVPRLKEWAYAGAFINLLGAVASNVVSGNAMNAFWALIFTVLAFASWALRPQSRTLGALFPTKPRRSASAQNNQAINVG
ncbi:MAG: DoxX family protein [Ktedonobacterales bacterium]